MSVLDNWIANKHLGGEISRASLEAWQLRKLRELILLAKEKSPYYSQALGEIPLPENFETFANYPTMDADTLRAQGMKLMCVPQKDISRVVSLETSGTQTASKRIFFTEEDQELTVDFFHYGMEEIVPPKGRTAVFLPWKSQGCVGDLLIKGLVRLGVSACGRGMIEDLQEASNYLLQEQPDTAVGVPVQILALTEYMKSRGMKNPLKRVLLSTDNLPCAVRARLEKENIEVFNHFGMTECGLGAALECGAHEGMHVRENDLYMEILDKEGNRLPDGTWGELAVTTLTRKGMPLIRYKTGDLARFLPGACSCGSVLKRLDKIRGRLGEETVFGQGIQMWDEVLFSVPGVADYHMCVEDGNMKLQIDTIGEDAEQVRRRVQEILEEKEIHTAAVSCREIREKLSPYEGKRRIRRI